MVINTLKHNYCVIHKLMEATDFEIFLCNETEEESLKYCRVIRLKSKELIHQLISVFMEQLNNQGFEDFYDCFSKDGDLYVVFLHSDSPLLIDRLSEDECSLSERLEIGKCFLERILLLNMPDMLLYDAIAEDNVTVSDAMEVSFNYDLKSIRRYGEIGRQETVDRIQQVFGLLFAHELKLEASIDLKDFMQELSQNQYNNYFEIYHSYKTLYEKLIRDGLVQGVKPNTLFFRLWKRIKGSVKYLKTALMLIVLLLLAGYLVYSILHPAIDASTVTTFQQIGTVEIQDGE